MDFLGLQTEFISVGEALARVMFAGVCGLVVGFDREAKHKPVGVRTYVLICMGAAAYAIISLELAFRFSAEAGDTTVDPSRLIQGIVGAFGFLGAGAIINAQGRPRGLASGAAIWLAGSAGVACGFGIIWFGLALSIVGALTMILLEWCQARLGTEKRVPSDADR